MCIGSVELCVYTEHDLNESLFPHFSDKFWKHLKTVYGSKLIRQKFSYNY